MSVVLAKLKSGGTATDVREAYIEMFGERIGVTTVKRILHLLTRIRPAKWETDGNARWWETAGHVPDSISIRSEGSIHN